MKKYAKSLKIEHLSLTVILFLTACIVEPPAASNLAEELEEITTTPILEIATLPVSSETFMPTRKTRIESEV